MSEKIVHLHHMIAANYRPHVMNEYAFGHTTDGVCRGYLLRKKP